MRRNKKHGNKSESLILLEEAEGRAQDTRARLLAAFYLYQDRFDSPQMNNLHVRELLTYVLNADHDGRGVQKSKKQIAKLLCCTVGTAHTVVRRARDEWGLLLVSEERYCNDGQSANRYSINWGGVDLILRQESSEAPLVSQGGPVVMEGAHVVSRGSPIALQPPNKEVTLTSSLTSKPSVSPSSPPALMARLSSDATTSLGRTWEEVEEALVALGVVVWDECLEKAKSRNVGSEHVWQLIEFWKSHRPRWTLGALVFRIGKAKPSISPERGWPEQRPQDAPKPPGSRRSTKSEPELVESIRAGILRSPAHRKSSPDEKVRLIREALVAAGIDCEKYPRSLEV